MGELTIQIAGDGTPSYPRGKTINPNDTVTFQLVNYTGEIEVTFDATNCCFTSADPLVLNGASLATSNQQKTVSPDARSSPPEYIFWAGPPTEGSVRRVGPPEWEAKTGTLDVSTDPPPPPKEKRNK